MILNITEKQKKLIESQGYMVIQFKAWAAKQIEWILRWSSRIIQEINDLWDWIISFLKQMKTSEMFKEISLCLRRIADKPTDIVENPIPKIKYEPRRKYPFARSIGRKYEPRYRQAVYLHRCRNNC